MMTSARRKPGADFIVRLDGGSIRPWEVPARALARILEAVQRLVDQREEGDDEAFAADDAEAEAARTAAHEIHPAATSGQVKEPSSVLRLIDIRSGSAVYRVSAPQPEATIRLLAQTGFDIASPLAAEWSPATLSSVKELSEVARSLGCTIEFRRPGKGQYGDVLASIGPRTYEAVSGSAFVSGYTSVFAKIERVGGAVARHCGIRLPSQPRRMVICRVGSEDLVRDLGKYIYREVVLMGTATWLRRNLRLKSLVISGFEPPKTGSIMDTLERVHQAGGSAWDSIEDPDAFIAEMRRT